MVEALEDLTVDMEANVENESHKDVSRFKSFTSLYIPKGRPVKEFGTAQVLMLAYQSLGVVYGDIGPSPLYVFSSMNLADATERDICGIFSLIFWILTSIALIKYVFVVLRADDHGEGGTFALYSLLCQHIKFKNKITGQPTRLDSDRNLTFHSEESRLKTKTKQFMESSPRAQSVLTFFVLLGTCMVIGDGALTPAISVLSAVQGIQTKYSKITTDHLVLICVIILVFLFMFQSYGTSKVSFSFSPIMLIWFSSTAVIGVYNTIIYYPGIFRAISPHYIYYFFARDGKAAWELLGAAFLCITGAEAMFADLGHFNKRSIQIAFSFIVYPALILTYAGEAAFLIKNPEKMSTTFYSCIPDSVFWPMFVIATLAAIVASQALISASFSIVRQSVALGCFPRVNIKHTSNTHEGQVYSPEINYFLMILSVVIVIVFKGGVEIGNAYGVVVVWVMIITTFLMVMVMLTIWATNIFLILLFFIPYFLIEGVFMTSLLNKVPQGGWLPFVISSFFLMITLSWTHGRSKKQEYEAENKLSLEGFNQLVSKSDIVRTPGICFFCTDLANGIPPIVKHTLETLGSLKEITIIVTLRILPIKSVLDEERFVVGKLGPRVYRCLVQYGYKDVPNMEGEGYIASIMDKVKEEIESPEEIRQLELAMKRGVVFVIGRTILKTGKSYGWFERFVIDTIYRFLQKNFRSTVSTMLVPPSKTLQVGMVYEI